VSVQYETLVRTILLIHSRWGNSCVGPVELRRVGRETLRRWTILIHSPGLSAAGGAVKADKPSRRSGTKLRHTAGLLLLPTVVQNHAEEAAMDCQPAAVAVVDKAQLPELIHEMADARPSGADHLCQVVLADAGDDRF
jgi:hypothetical protein